MTAAGDVLLSQPLLDGSTDLRVNAAVEQLVRPALALVLGDRLPGIWAYHHTGPSGLSRSHHGSADLAVLGTRAHEALIAVLIIARESAGMTQRDVIARLPAWLGWIQSTLAEVETGRRVAAFEEVRALCELYGTNIASIELQAQAYEAAIKQCPGALPRELRARRSPNTCAT